jgi:two-component system, LytTR family, sensor kinase
MSLAARLGLEPPLVREALAIGAAAWGVISLVTSGQLFVQAQVDGAEAGFFRILFWMACAWGPWVPAAVVVAAVVQRQRGAPRAAALLVHALCALLLGLLHVVLFAAVSALLAPPWAGGQRATFTQELAILLLSYFYSELVLYGAVAAGVSALRGRRELRQRELAASQLAHQLADAQLQALRIQERPHFLFNALNTVAMMVRTGDSAAAVGMLASLSDLLRWSLRQEPREEVPLAEELSAVDRYLEVERWRLGDRLVVHRRVAPELADCLVPSFLLQPLVENAIRHGIARRPGVGNLELGARESEGMLELGVGDDGAGLALEAAEELVEGVGLRTVRRRLARLGAGAALMLRARPGGGVEATVRLPLRRDATAVPEPAPVLELPA